MSIHHFDHGLHSVAPPTGIDHVLLESLEIDEETKADALQLWEIIGSKLPSALEVFYGKLRPSPYGTTLTNELVAELMERQARHWAMLFTSGFSPEYLSSARRIGIQHREAAVEVKWYIAAYMMLKMEFVDIIVRTNHSALAKGRIIRALDRYFAVDMGLALSTYTAGLID